MFNIVYDSRDRRDHINRRIFKKIYNEIVVMNDNYNTRKIACNHKDIHYIVKYVNMIKKYINAIIMSLLKSQKKKN